ncbi:hypothetical protein GS8_1573 [Geobacillus stearothermophilus]|uniref:Uncharacterized protein n=1 Tax=Geobacillus stearothermophilus TaxID=1422 RepID=A0ABQ7HFB3_GEOSE|nr:hypothetical protein GS8_1573 [Geobacillus stearothermophilus]
MPLFLLTMVHLRPEGLQLQKACHHVLLEPVCGSNAFLSPSLASVSCRLQ